MMKDWPVFSVNKISKNIEPWQTLQQRIIIYKPDQLLKIFGSFHSLAPCARSKAQKNAGFIFFGICGGMENPVLRLVCGDALFWLL